MEVKKQNKTKEQQQPKIHQIVLQNTITQLQQEEGSEGEIRGRGVGKRPCMSVSFFFFKIREITLQITFTEYMYIYISCIYIYIHTETIFPKEKQKCRYSRSLKMQLCQKKWIEQIKPSAGKRSIIVLFTGALWPLLI